MTRQNPKRQETFKQANETKGFKLFFGTVASLQTFLSVGKILHRDSNSSRRPVSARQTLAYVNEMKAAPDETCTEYGLP